ncbi:MAG: restriction endonuclease subunit S [Anaerolineae bacterium]|nr:restriction endonuclease subunit S [Anaerolineae bacterium]
MTTNGTEERPLPDGWTWTTIGEITEPERDRVSPQDFAELPFLGMDDIETQTMRLLGTKSSSEMRSLAEHFWPDDVLYGSLRPYLNKVYRPDFEGLCSAEFIVFRKTPQLISKYLQYFLNQWSFVAFINKQNTGDRPRVKFGQMADYPFPLAPLDEQERIVAEIEKQFTRLDQAVAGLRRLQNNLARYKASVLKAACDGRLVPQDPNDEPAADLLARILAERRAQWQAAHPGKKYQEAVGVGDTAVLPKLPEGWIWASIGYLFDVKVGATPSRKKPEYWNGDIPWVSSGEIAFGRISKTRETITTEGLNNSSVKLNPKGTVLLAMIGEGKTRGQAAILEMAATNNQNAAAILCADSPIMSEWVFYWLMAKYEETRQGGSGGMQPALNSVLVRAISIAVPPLAEQKRIVAEVERRLSVVTATEQAIATNLARAERLRQSILHRAFTGQLVSQYKEAT